MQLLLQGWNSLPKPAARGGIPCPNLPGRMHRAALGSSALHSQHWIPKLSAHTAVCPSGRLRRNSLSLDQAHITHTSTGLSPSGITDYGGKVEPGEEQEDKEKMSPWLLLCYKCRHWISGKRIHQIPIWKSLAPRTFPHPSENPPF